MAQNELKVIDNFELATFSGELAEAIAEEMDGLGPIPFDRVRIPSGGGISFEVPGDDEENPESAAEITGVILDHHPVNAYWANKFNGDNEQPDCSSLDGKQGVDRETGELKDCADCPYNQFGSDDKGKACKNVHRVYMLREGNPVPLILSLPPTSLKHMRNYIGKQILLKGLRCWQAVTKISLKKEKNAKGISYSRAVFSFAGKLATEQAQEAEDMKEIIRNTYRQIALDDADYSTSQGEAQAPPKADESGFMKVEDNLEELPFS